MRILDELTNPIAVDDDGNDGNELDHIYCCDENRALCGTDVSEVPIVDLDSDDQDLCIVCRDLEFRQCERCGF